MLIGFTGQIGAGKDTAYERVCALADTWDGARPERVSFAAKLKLAAATALGVEPGPLETMKRDDSARVELWVNGFRYAGQTVRSYLQRFGTEVGRDLFGDNFWVDQALPLDFNHVGRLVCVTDVRFPNEAERVRALGGSIIRLRNGELTSQAHASEVVLDASFVDAEIDNSVRNDGFAHLDEQLDRLLMYKRVASTMVSNGQSQKGTET